jgi:alpha-tubulin suppressor-like RCC1 family protein
MKKIIFLFLIIATWQIQSQCWQTFSLGYNHTMAIKPDGTLWGWGANTNGELGNGTVTGTPIPIQIGIQSNWLKVVAGDRNTMAIKTDGTLWVWGDNLFGQVGNNTSSNNVTIPTQVGIDTDWNSMSAGFEHVAAIKNNGTLWVWGSGGNGQIGNNLLLNRALPTQVGLDTDWTTVCTGLSTTMALKSNGSLWSWGRNDLGQLGLGFGSINRKVPVQVGGTDWVKISTKSSHTSAIKSDGTLWHWGRQTGGSPTFITNLNIPTQVGTATNWSKISSGTDHNLAIKTDGSLWAWLGNGSGQLGNNSTTRAFAPVQIGSDTNWDSIHGGSQYSAGIKTDGTFFYWGSNVFNHYGNNSTVASTIPLLISCPASLSNLNFSKYKCGVVPNPSNGIFTILTENPQEDAIISVVELNGRIVYNSNLINLNSQSVDLSNLQNGTYILNISNSKYNHSQKLIKQ